MVFEGNRSIIHQLQHSELGSDSKKAEGVEEVFRLVTPLFKPASARTEHKEVLSANLFSHAFGRNAEHH